MPFLPDEESTLAFDRAIGIDEMPEVEATTTFQERLNAAYRLDNTIGSFFAQEKGLPDGAKDTPYNPWNDLTEDEKLDERFVDNVLEADSIDELNAVRSQYEREQRDRSILQEGGLLPSLVAGVVDPINFIPVGGTAYRTYRTGGSILTGAMATAGAAASSSAITEAALHHTQLTRTYGESAVNITASAFLGGVLGAAPGTINRLFSKQDLEDIERSMDPESVLAEGGNPAMTDRSIGAAQVMDDVNIRGKFVQKVMKAMPLDPLTRTITNTSEAARKLVTRLAENPLDVDRDIGASAETLIKIHDGKLYEALTAHKNIYKEYQQALEKRSTVGGFFTGQNARNYREFNELVAKAVRNGSEDPIIQKAADAWDQKLYKPMRDEAINVGLLPEDVDVETAKNYLNRVWNKEKVASKYPQFIETVSQWLDDQNVLKQEAKTDIDKNMVGYQASVNQVRRASNRLEAKETELRVAKKQLFEAQRAKKPDQRQLNRITDLSDRVGRLESEIKQASNSLEEATDSVGRYLNDLETSVANFPSKISKKIRKAIANRDGREATKASKELIKAVRAITKTDYEDVDTYDLAAQIAGRIMATTDGRLPYDYKMGEVSGGGTGEALAGPFKSRSFVIPDDMVEDFLENDIEVLGARYLQGVAPDIELTKAFGSVDPKQWPEMKDIERDFQDLMEKETSEAKRRKLQKEMNTAKEDFVAMVERMRGIYAVPDANNPFVRAGRVARDLNYMRLLGGVVAASIPDVARVFAAEGIANTFRHGLKPLVTNMKAFKVAGEEAKRYGVATDALMGGRAEIIADVADYAAGGTAFERGVRSMATRFSSVNLMNQWTGGIKMLHAVTAQTRIIDDMMKGRYDKRLGQLGINKDDYESMSEYVRKHAKNIDGVWVANSGKWENQDLARMWGAALRKESDRVIIVPGQEKPLFMSREMGKTFLQFKTFMFSATQRVLLSNLQRQDAHYIQGILSLVSLGMMSYAFKEWDANRELSDDPKAWVVEGIDRSGMLGILMEANNTIEKISGNTYGFRPMLDISAPASRYASRSVAESMLGPTFGSTLTTVTKVANAATDQGEWTAADTRALRRLLPGQNLSIIRQLLDKIEQSIQE